MSPIAVHLHMLPFAALKSSSQGRTLTRRARVSVHEAVQPESIGARKIGIRGVGFDIYGPLNLYLIDGWRTGHDRAQTVIYTRAVRLYKTRSVTL